MSDNIIELYEHQSHITLQTIDGNVHVIPEMNFRRVVNGDMAITDWDEWELIVRSVFKDWLTTIEPG